MASPPTAVPPRTAVGAMRACAQLM